MMRDVHSFDLSAPGTLWWMDGRRDLSFSQEDRRGWTVPGLSGKQIAALVSVDKVNSGREAKVGDVSWCFCFFFCEKLHFFFLYMKETLSENYSWSYKVFLSSWQMCSFHGLCVNVTLLMWHLGRSLLTDTEPGEMTELLAKVQNLGHVEIYGGPKDGSRSAKGRIVKG